MNSGAGSLSKLVITQFGKSLSFKYNKWIPLKVVLGTVVKKSLAIYESLNFISKFT
jgi:hypothetical protein